MDKRSILAETGRVVERYLACGDFGDVYEVSSADGVPETMKLTRKWSLIREAHIKAVLGAHPCVLGLRGVVELRNGDVAIFEECMPGAQWLRSAIDAWELGTVAAAQVALQVAQGLEFLHSKQVTCWNVTPETIMVDLHAPPAAKRDSLSCFVSCFGQAAVTVGAVKLADVSSATLSRQCFRGCSKKYASPETLKVIEGGDDKALAAESQDEWAWACVFTEMLPKDQLEDGLKDSSLSLIQKCFQAAPRKRPSAARLVERLTAVLEMHCVRIVSSRPTTPLASDALVSLHTHLGKVFLKADDGVAESHLKAALAISDDAAANDALGELYHSQGRVGEAQRLYEKAVRVSAHDAVDLPQRLTHLAKLYEDRGLFNLSKGAYDRATALNAARLGADHSTVAAGLSMKARVLRSQGDLESARQLYQRAVAIADRANYEKLLVSDLKSLADVYREIGLFEEAEPLYERVISLDERTLGRSHPNLATDLCHLAGFYVAQGEHDEARPLLERAVTIYARAFGETHTLTDAARRNLARIM